jgi:hypothetical protein
MAEIIQDFGESFCLLLRGVDRSFLLNFPKFQNIPEHLFPFTVHLILRFLKVYPSAE